MKKITAEKFNKSPGSTYRAADKGEDVEITHNHYPDRVFNLTAKDRVIKSDNSEYTVGDKIVFNSLSKLNEFVNERIEDE